MPNYSRFSGFAEGSALPEGTYVCVVDSDRLSSNKCNVKGQRGVAYSVKDDPDSLYVIGDGFYWRGPVSETHRFEVVPNKTVEVRYGDTTIGEAMLDELLKEVYTASLKPSVYDAMNGTFGNSSNYNNYIVYARGGPNITSAPKGHKP